MNSPRSLLAKNAIITLSEIFEQEGVNLHNKYDIILKNLIKRNSDKNAVISEEADKSLTSFRSL